MNKAVMISIHPKWCELIANGKKTVEVRKTKPKLETSFKVYIYCTNTPKHHHLYDLRPYNKSGKIKLGCVQHNSTSLVASNYINGKVIGYFVCDKVEQICCRTVPYRKTNNLGYEHFLDNGVYQVDGFEYGPDNAVVFERNDIKYIDTMFKNEELAEMCLTPQQLYKYIGLGNDGYAWHISNLVIYDKPKELSEFINLKGEPITRAFQSWGYVEEQK